MKVHFASKLFVYGILLLGALAFTFPFVYMIMTSFIKSVYSLPKPQVVFSAVPNLHNFEVVWGKNHFLRYFGNSLLITTVSVLGSLAIGCITAYAFARFAFPGKELIFRLFLLTMMMPAVVGIIPVFIIIKNLGLVDTYRGLWLVYISTSVMGSVFFLRGFFQSIPKELEESVLMDGGGNWRILWNIYLPMSKPAIGTMAIFSFMGTWQEFFTALVILKTGIKRTLPIAFQMLNDQFATNYGWVFAAAIIMLIPVMLIYVIFQKRFVQGGFNEGAVKG
ncbi:carbohydrate ABC transporter permease [Gorillibacterium massiliense]|uniref:carbohydrate ABC transporter permease n=1 Tax=Gorillibacterium massiliense TaxID=1280390 RepID=UPI0004B5D47F|nr:carbohydrate ABC transporter permease [Gorillibacterium massiliense]